MRYKIVVVNIREKHGKEESTVTRHSRRQKSMEYAETKYKGTRGMKGHEDLVEQVFFVEHSKRTWNIFKVEEYGTGTPRSNPRGKKSNGVTNGSLGGVEDKWPSRVIKTCNKNYHGLEILC